VSPHRVTIAEAVHLTGRARRSLYRDMGAGRLSYHVGPNGRRLVDVSELIRAYGALPGVPEEAAPEHDTPEQGAGGGGAALSARLLAELVELTRQQGETLAAQREELAALRREVAELRTLPAPGQLAPHPDHDRPQRERQALEEETPADPAPARSFADLRQQDRPPARSFADLLEKLNARG